jgi:septal ring factor EnvC (AmiA/AmiB activator)
MSRLAEFRALEKNLADQLAALEALKGDSGLQREIEFEQKLRELLAQYGYSLRDIIALLDPQAAAKRRGPAAAAPEKATRRAREIKVYKNPHTDEVVETKGGNHKVLKEWKAKYGAETVESWRS